MNLIFKRLIEKLTEEKKAKENCVISGHINDFPTYRGYIGNIKGLEDAITICKNTYKGSEDEQDR